ncbi:MAG: dihydroorotase, partial [Gammaproteobacteria bacterium]|nr:dihydroorotase [Gammaproteobacteria bacterium]
MKQVTLARPDDWHLHLRDDAVMASVLPHTAERFARAIVMPNLRPPVTTTEQAQAYRQRIMAALPAGMDFNPLMTLYLTDNTTPEEITRTSESGFIKAVKLYPAGATTNSDSGLTDINKVYPSLETMAKLGMPLLVHGEVTNPDIDVFDRERIFLDTVLQPLLERLPELKLVFEHITTREAADFVNSTPDNVAANITPQHLLLNRNAMLVGGIHPHNYCLPVLKRETHREALVN